MARAGRLMSLSRLLSLLSILCLLLSSLTILVSLQSDNAMAVPPPWGDDMEGGPGMWKTYSNGKGTDWQWGIPQNEGPNSTHSGVNTWGTNIAGNYTKGTLAYLESPPFDLALSTNTRLIFWHYLDTEDFFTHDWDGGLIEISIDAGRSWTQVDDGSKPNPNPYYDMTLRDTRGNPLGGRNAYCYDQFNWTKIEVDLSQYDGSTNLLFRFTFGSDNYVDSPGWYIDDVMLAADVREGIIIEPDQHTLAMDGTFHGFNLSIKNLQAASELVDIAFTDDLGWPVALFQADGVSPLVDSGGLPGVQDTGLLLPGAAFDIVVNVTVPPGTPYSTHDVIRVDGIPFFGSAPTDSAYISISTPSPDVAVEDFLVPQIHDSGHQANITAVIGNLGVYPRTFDVRLDVYGPGPVTYNPIQTVLNLKADETEAVTWIITPTVPGDYTLTVETMLLGDSVQENNISTRTMTVMIPIFEDDMEVGGPASLGQWIPGSNPQTAWELGVPTVIGPTECHSLTDCWGTNLDSEYEKGADLRLEMPPVNLSDSERVVLRFWHFVDIHGPFMNDGGFVEVSTDDGLSWLYVEPVGGYPALVDLTAPAPPGGGAGVYAGFGFGWEEAQFDLTSFADEEISIGFHLWTDPSNYQSGWAGWYIDDVQVFHVPLGAIPIFTEVQDSGLGGERIEVYNAGKKRDNLNNYYLAKEGGGVVAGSWSVTQINPGQYSVFTTTGNELDDDGELIQLVNASSDWIEDQFGYGQKGVVPDPVSGESSGRIWNGTAYDERWTRSSFTTFGFPNNVPSWAQDRDIVLNEVFFNAQTPGEEFVEIMYKGNSSINIRNYVIVCDSPFTIGSDIILNTIQNHYILLPTDYIGLFAQMDPSGENLYLYDAAGSFLDMAGWSSSHNPGESMSRVPEGNGTQDGYDDLSSYMAGWRFGRLPTMALIGVWPDQIEYGDLGDTVTYGLTLLNQPADDLISFTMNASIPWQVNILKQDWTPMMDTNSDGWLDTGPILASSFFNFSVNVTIPSQPPVGSEMIAEIYVNSTLNRGRDVAVLKTRTSPHLEPTKTADPEEIHLEGVGTNEVTEITLEVLGGGYVITELHPQDTVFVIDSSASMDANDPLNLRLDATKKYVDNMSVPDRGAVVDFDDTATLVPRPSGDHLSTDYAKIKQNIDTIDANGGTNIGAGLQAANSELIGYGNSSHLWVEILLTDGHESFPNYDFTSQQIQDAVDNNITIFTVGLGGGVNESLLREIADRTGGKYYYARNAEALEDIYSRIGLLVFDIAGRDVNVTDAIPMIRDVVPPYIHVNFGSFSTFPDEIYNTTDGLVLEWNVSQILVNDTWVTSYEATCSQLGWVPVGVYPKARVQYISWDNQNEIMPFPDTLIHVVLPPIGPPKNLRTSVENGVDIRLDWSSPSGATLSYYLIYRSEHQMEFDFTNPTYNTSGDPNPTRTDWTDSGAAGPGSPMEYYYIVRAVDVNGSMSTTSNTAGKWTRSFQAGLNSFSLPLEPFYSTNISQLALDIPNAELIRWMDDNGRWITHVAGMGDGVNDDVASVGRGYEISHLSGGDYTFVGFPGSMISHHEGFGDSVAFRKSLMLSVQDANVTLSWQDLPGASAYEVYRSPKRDGLFEDALTPIATVTSPSTSYTDFGMAVTGRELYYWIIPLGAGEQRGSGTYSIGLSIQTYGQGSDTFSLPLKLDVAFWIDDLCDIMEGMVGMAYVTNGMWKFHAKEMPSQVYDVVVIQSLGYQISTTGSSHFVFVGS